MHKNTPGTKGGVVSRSASHTNHAQFFEGKKGRLIIGTMKYMQKKEL